MTTHPNEPHSLKLRPNRTFICSVVFIDIVEYTKKTVNEQIRIKERFNVILSETIKDISVSDRIILDTGDGAAISFLGDPEDALFVAMSLRNALKGEDPGGASFFQVRMGINLGPVKLLQDINNQPNLIGDGINVAQRIMSFAEPEQLLVSRSYYDIVSCLSQEYAKLFQYHGVRADKHIREHDIYAVEHTGQKAVPAKPSPEVRPLREEVIPVPASEAPRDAAVALPEPAAKADQPGKGKTWLFIGGSVAAAIMAAFIFFSKGKTPTEDTKAAAEGKSATTSKSVKVPEKTAKGAAPAATAPDAPSQDTAVEKKTVPAVTAFKTMSSKADDILFTVVGMKSTGGEATFTVRMQNRSGVEKSVALYDDTFRWTRSSLTDGQGKKTEVSKVSFVKASKRVTMSAAGTQGIPIPPKESVTTYMTFKQAGKGTKALTLHPFIYQGRSWKEHDLTMKWGS